MFARVATFENVDVSRADEVLQTIRERTLPVIRELSGWAGSLTLVDPDARRVLAISFFDTKEDIQAAESTFEEMPRHLPDDLRQLVAGTRRSVDVFEVKLQEGVRVGEEAVVGI